MNWLDFLYDDTYTFVVGVEIKYSRGVIGLPRRDIHQKSETNLHSPVKINPPPNPEPGYVLIPEDVVLLRIDQMAEDIAHNNQNHNLMAVTVLNGATFFGTYLLQQMAKHGYSDVDTDSIRVSTYKGLTKGSNTRVTPPKNPVNGRRILLIEDIVDTAETMDILFRFLINHGAQSIITAALLSKPSRRKLPFEADYTGFDIPNVWVEGWGMDTDERARLEGKVKIGYERTPRQFEKNPYLLAGFVAKAELAFARLRNPLQRIKTGNIFSRNQTTGK